MGEGMTATLIVSLSDSQVFALDLFSVITQRGMEKPDVGIDFVAKVMGKGGSDDPMNLIRDFLQREPNQDAFYNRLQNIN
jgi:Zn-dependent oligopeptidase